MEVGVIVSGLSLAKSIAEFFGLIESVTNQKLDSLIQAEFGAGLSLLEQATQSKNEQISLLREARNCFTKATVLEKNERLFFSYLGLAACHHHLGDEVNAKRALRELLKTEVDFFDYKGMALATVSDAPLFFVPGLVPGLKVLTLVRLINPKLFPQPPPPFLSLLFESNLSKFMISVVEKTKKIQELKQSVGNYLIDTGDTTQMS